MSAPCQAHVVRRRPMTTDEARDAIMRHLERMDRVECIFVFNKGGYLGNSVVMELGYAYAQRKPVYVLAPIHDPFLMPFVCAWFDEHNYDEFYALL